MRTAILPAVLVFVTASYATSFQPFDTASVQYPATNDDTPTPAPDNQVFDFQHDAVPNVKVNSRMTHLRRMLFGDGHDEDEVSDDGFPDFPTPVGEVAPSAPGELYEDPLDGMDGTTDSGDVTKRSEAEEDCDPPKKKPKAATHHAPVNHAAAHPAKHGGSSPKKSQPVFDDQNPHHGVHAVHPSYYNQYSDDGIQNGQGVQSGVFNGVGVDIGMAEPVQQIPGQAVHAANIAENTVPNLPGQAASNIGVIGSIPGQVVHAAGSVPNIPGQAASNIGAAGTITQIPGQVIHAANTVPNIPGQAVAGAPGLPQQAESMGAGIVGQVGSHAMPGQQQCNCPPGHMPRSALMEHSEL